MRIARNHVSSCGGDGLRQRRPILVYDDGDDGDGDDMMAMAVVMAVMLIHHDDVRLRRW